MAEKCIHIKDNGEPCGAKTMLCADYCFFHHPDLEDERKAASAKGGKAGKPPLPPPGPPVSVSLCTAGDRRKFRQDLLQRSDRGEDRQVIGCVIQLLNYLLRCLKVKALEKRVLHAEALSKASTQAPTESTAAGSDLAESALESAASIHIFLESTMSKVLNGQIDTSKANIAGTIANSQLAELAEELEIRQKNLIVSQKL
jgi:hypothetical protein